MIDFVTVSCFRYEQEIKKRSDAEQEFVMLKKVCKAAREAFILKVVQTTTKETDYRVHCSVCCRR